MKKCALCGSENIICTSDDNATVKEYICNSCKVEWTSTPTSPNPEKNKPKVISPEGKIVIEHTLINRHERRRREKLRKVKYTKRNKPYVKGDEKERSK